MQAIRDSIRQHGRIARVRRLSASEVVLSYADRFVHSVVIPEAIERSGITEVSLIGIQDQGILIEFQNGDWSAQFFSAAAHGATKDPFLRLRSELRELAN